MPKRDRYHVILDVDVFEFYKDLAEAHGISSVSEVLRSVLRKYKNIIEEKVNIQKSQEEDQDDGL